MAKAVKLFWVVVIIAMVVVAMAVPPECEEYGTCINDEDCQVIHDDSYCYDQGACGTDENGEKLGYCYGIDACSEYPHCTVLADCPADGNTYVDCCEFGICPDGLGYCC